MTSKFSVGTHYGGCAMRSKLERDVGRRLDDVSMRWQYEPKRFSIETGSYLPDFKLLETGQFVEVKGSESDSDRRRHRRFVREFDAELVVLKQGEPYMLFSCARPRSFDDSIVSASNMFLLSCSECGNKSFVPVEADWSCRSCGFSDGDRTKRKTVSSLEDLE